MAKYYLGRDSELWNEFASSSNAARSWVERQCERWMLRTALPELSSSQLRVWLFIKSRTLDWQKFAEAIPMSHFLDGMRGSDGELLCGSDGEPFTSGCGIAKEDTVRTAVKALERAGAITVFPGRRGSATPANVYMPLSRRHLAFYLIEGGSGVLPKCAPFTVGEHVRRINTVWQVVATENDLLHIREVLSGGILSHREATDRQELVERLTPEEWKAFSGRKLRAVA